MGIAAWYAGQKLGGIVNPIPVPAAPQFSSAEVGNVNDITIAVTFDSVIVSDGSDYSSGVTIKVNGSTRAFESAIRQANHAVVYYALSLAVANGDTVTWEYSAAAGAIVSESNGLALQDVSAQNVTNNVAPDPGVALRADAIAYYALEEDGLSNRLDSTSHHWDLSPDDVIPIASDTGKIGNAVCQIYLCDQHTNLPHWDH